MAVPKPQKLGAGIAITRQDRLYNTTQVSPSLHLFIPEIILNYAGNINVQLKNM